MPVESAEQLLSHRFKQIPTLLDGNATLMTRGRFLSVDCLIQIGSIPFHLTFAEGRIVRLERETLLMGSWTFAIRFTAEALLRFWQPVPEPGYHDLFALTKRGDARIEGDLRPLMANLQYIKDLLALPRTVPGGRD